MNPPLTFIEVAIAVRNRTHEWEPDGGMSLEYRGLELAGEAGEACNQLKKLIRAQIGMVGGETSLEPTAEELADTIISSVGIANHLGIDIAQAVRNKFNKTTAKNNLTTTIR